MYVNAIYCTMVFVDTFVLGAREFSKKTRPLRESAARVVLRRANYLEQARTLAEFLAENRSRPQLPPPALRVSRVEYCVCTPLAENIPSPETSNWLDDETPRISVPQELIEYVTASKPRLLG